MSQIEPDRGQIVPSVEGDATSLLAQNAFSRALDARARADEAYSLATTVASNASNANLNATTAQSLANAAQADVDALELSALTTAGGTLYGPLFLQSANPTGSTQAAHKAYVDYAVSANVNNIFDSLQASKADKSYVDTQDTALQSQITTGASQITDLYTKIIPVGAIIMWAGSVASIPTGWRLCNGQNGTPDLRNRFIIGAGSTYTPAQTGGLSNYTTSISGNHSHTGTIATAGDHVHSGSIFGTILGIEHIPPHNHTVSVNKSNADSTGGTSFVRNIAISGEPTLVVTTDTGGGQPHSHGASISTAGAHTHSATIDANGSHTHTVDVTPPYYALCFIQKI